MNSYPLADIHTHIGTHIDVFICSSSFEPRCFAVPKHLDTGKISKVLVAQNENNVQYVGENGKQLLNHFGNKSSKVDLDTNNPLKTADSLNKALEDVYTNYHQTFVVDISTFTRESLLILIELLRHSLKTIDTLHLVYVGAQKYSHSEEDANVNLQNESIPEAGSANSRETDQVTKLWLSRGLREVRSVLGYPGAGIPSQDLHLIVLVGFEYERASQLVEVYDPAVLSLGYSPDETMPGYAEMNKNFHEKVAALYGNEAQKFTFSAIDPIVTRDAILAQVRKHANYNTVVCAMNTKISTVGAAFAAFEDETIQLSYAQAETYNIKGYSEPKNSFYLFTPDMSELVLSSSKNA